MYTNTHKSWFYQLVVLLLVVTLTGIGFSARGDSEERSRGRQKSKPKEAAASRESESTEKSQSRSSVTSSARSQGRQKASSPQASQQRQRAASPSRQTAFPQKTTRSAQPAQSISSVQSTRSANRHADQQIASQSTPQSSTTVPARRANRTVEVVSTAQRNNSNSNRAKVSTRASSVSSAGNARSKTSSVSRTVITPAVSVKSKASAVTPTTRNRDINRVSSSRTRKTPQRTVSRAVQEITAKSSAPTVTRKSQKFANRTSAKKSSVSFNVYGAAFKKRTAQAASVAIQTQTNSRNTHGKTTTPVRVTANDIKVKPNRAIVSNTSSKDNFKSKSAGSRHAGLGRSKSSSTIIINNNNQVIVQGGPTRHRPRPYIQPRLFKNITYIQNNPLWVSYSGGFYFNWSSSSCGVAVCLPYNYSSVYYTAPSYGLSYYYPRYHRKYVFVSIGGYWPYGYRHRRYYWYGCHPYYWYGARATYQLRPSVTYNTYNNYYDTDAKEDTAGYGFSGSDNPYYTLGSPKDPAVDEPEFETAADLCFDRAVALFAAGNYDDAVEQFREAVRLSPDDVILPFTYSQALFSAGDYAHAAAVLRAALDKIPEDELTIYFPRGLYEDEAVLTDQIQQLKNTAQQEPFASDYQLLLGYQYLGTGELEKAHMPLLQASKDAANQEAAGKLMDLAVRLQEES